LERPGPPGGPDLLLAGSGSTQFFNADGSAATLDNVTVGAVVAVKGTVTDTSTIAATKVVTGVATGAARRRRR
jgi:hypothetical protein